MSAQRIRAVDVAVIGAGAAGLFCAGRIRGRTVIVLDHARKPAEKVRISGGGRCNFTNINTSPENFISQNPHFAKSALARFSPRDFMDILARHKIAWHEKTLGQLFCDEKSDAVIRMLLDEVARAGASLQLETTISAVAHDGARYLIETDKGAITSTAVVMASGGLSIPKMGASGFAYDVARQFGHRIVTPRPGLVPFVFTGALQDRFAGLAGVATRVRASLAAAAFDEAMLFTHRGLSGPAILQISSYWREGEAISVNLAPQGMDLKALQASAPKRTIAAALDAVLPRRLVEDLCEARAIPYAQSRLADLSKDKLASVAAGLSDWRITPAGTEGWRTAEVTVGGVATDAISSKTMESRNQPGLYFIGEGVDVTGWLGGYNFQWAWASAAAAAEALSG